jgi:hypothetical protein
MWIKKKKGDDGYPFLSWSTREAEENNGVVEKGTIMFYTHTHKGCFNYGILYDKEQLGSPEFEKREVYEFIGRGIFELAINEGENIVKEEKVEQEPPEDDEPYLSGFSENQEMRDEYE